MSQRRLLLLLRNVRLATASSSMSFYLPAAASISGQAWVENSGPGGTTHGQALVENSDPGCSASGRARLPFPSLLRKLISPPRATAARPPFVHGTGARPSHLTAAVCLKSIAGAGRPKAHLMLVV